MTLLIGRRDVLETGAKQLLEKETLNEPELRALREALTSGAGSEGSPVAIAAAVDGPRRSLSVASQT